MCLGMTAGTQHVKRGAFTALLGCVVLLALPVSAGAQPSIKTKVEIDGVFNISMGSEVIIVGHVSSPNPKCVAGRRLKVFANFPDGTSRFLDTGQSGAKGYWASSGDVFHVTGVTARVTKRTFGPRKHRRTCAPASGSRPVLRQ